jgi:hypothetical protein
MVVLPSAEIRGETGGESLDRPLLTARRMKRLLFALAATALASPSAFWLLACGAGNAASPSTSQDASAAEGGGGVGGDDGGGAPDAASTSDSGGGGTPVTVTFSYTPQWSGVTKVEVVGGFGLASDWSKTESLVTLAASGSTYSGTASLPQGTYLYVFRLTGDAQAPNSSTYARYGVDPLNTSFAPCPSQSPTFSKVDANPCSQIVVGPNGAPSPGGATAVHVKGSITLDGAAAKDWMVILEREEPQSHHFFANRLTAAADGAFDLVASAGHYRLQVWHPTLLAETDLQRDPVQLAALRRAISNAIPLASSDVTVVAPDLGFHSYAQFAPTVDGGALPTQFSFESDAETRLTIYGGPGDGGVVDIGDPWYASPPTTGGAAPFAGTFDTAQRMQDAAVPGTRYMWGTEETFGADGGADASTAWTKQTMVFPITWH